MGALTICKKFINDTRGDAIVEATIIFPIIIMIFAALVLLSFYMPTSATLQRATQHAATVIATELSDTWIFYDEGSMEYYTKDKKDELDNVYSAFFNSIKASDYSQKAEMIVREAESRSLSYKGGELTVEYELVNRIIYKEIRITAKRVIPVGINLSFIGFPKEIPITVSSIAVVQNGDEFVRNMDIAVDLTRYLGDEHEGIGYAFTKVKEIKSKFGSALGW